MTRNIPRAALLPRGSPSASIRPMVIVAMIATRETPVGTMNVSRKLVITRPSNTPE